MFLALVLASTPLFLKRDMTRVHDGMPLKDYPTTIIIPPSNSNKFLLQTDINQSIIL